MRACTFAGHTEVYAAIGDRLTDAIEQFLKETDGAVKRLV